MTRGRKDDDRLIYSSERGRIGADPKSPRSRPRDAPPAAGDGVARVRREKKGRRGKTVTTISGLGLDEAALRELGGDLKRACGSGGSVKDGVIEIQGDHRDTLLAELAARGHRAKAAGG